MEEWGRRLVVDTGGGGPIWTVHVYDILLGGFASLLSVVHWPSAGCAYAHQYRWCWWCRFLY